MDGKDALLELMAEELAALKRQIAELRRPEQSERRPEQPERAEQKPEQGSRATSLAAQARTGARNVSALGPAGAGHAGVASADAPAPSLAGLGGATAPPARFARRPTLPTLKLGTYDGRTSLETFLAKFNNCSEYYAWDAREQLCHLRASLEKEAGQILWDADNQSTVDDVTSC